MTQLTRKEEEKISKFLSYVLRHKPETINLKLDEYGWASIEELIRNSNEYGTLLNLEILSSIVQSDEKSRYSISENGLNIRANQGHSIEVNLELKKQVPPVILYHGTADRFLDDIMKSGLSKMSRQYVHLSDNLDTAKAVGNRHGKVVILSIDTAAMYKDKFDFYKSENGVWLTDNVPPKYIMNISK